MFLMKRYVVAHISEYEERTDTFHFNPSRIDVPISNSSSTIKLDRSYFPSETQLFGSTLHVS
jgi:hypothetical protein